MVQWRRKDGKWLHMVPFIPTHTNPLNYELHLVHKYYIPTPVFLPGESQGWGTWLAAIYGVSQSRTRLKWLSSSSSIPTHTNPLNYELHLVNIYYLCYRIEYIQFNTSQFRQRERYQGVWDFSLCLLSHTLLPPNTRDYLNPKFHISHSRISLHRFILIYVCIPSQYSTYWLGFASFWPLHWWTSTWTDGITDIFQ